MGRRLARRCGAGSHGGACQVPPTLPRLLPSRLPPHSAVSNVEAGRPSCALKGVAAEAAAAAAEAEEQAEEAAEAAAVAQAEEAGAYSDEESEMEVDENGDPNGQPSRKRHHTGSAAR